MLEVGVTTANLHDCGPNNDQLCPPLTVTESRSHFGAWAIVSSPLTLGFDFSDAATVDKHWDTVTNTDAIEINQDYVGFSGSLFASSADVTSFSPCSGSASPGGSNVSNCVFPTAQSWYKPLSGRDSRQSIMAVLLINNGDAPRDLSFTFTEIPGLQGPAPSSFCLYDVWEREHIEGQQFGGYMRKAVASHDSVFLTLSNCM